MAWQGIEGHDAIVERFRRSLRAGRLPSTFLFVGPAGIGKRTLAAKLAQALLCETNPEQALDPCGMCPACQQVAAQSHPDLEMVSKPPDKSFIPVEAFIGDREHRLSEGLCHNIALKASRGRRKIAIIDDADYLNPEGANCLLKTLEEPPPRSLIILIGTSEQRQLPTIRSRCQTMRFHALPEATVASLLLSTGLVEGQDEAEQMAALSTGSLERARQLANAELRQFRTEFWQRLTGLRNSTAGVATEVGAFVDAAGKDAPPRRERLKVVVQIALDYYCAVLRALSAGDLPADPELRQAVQAALQQNLAPRIEAVADSVDRCLDAQNQVDANANQATLIECWLDDLGLLAQREF